ncbi:MAG TPA: TIM barrel protein [Alloacidobacterium sp.]|nr:TIM barrel protein [Alloacidobacterium sp.]
MHIDDRFEMVMAQVDQFSIELPSWGFANTGTRFGKFLQPGAAGTLEEKFADAAQVRALTGATPSMALHVLWDLPEGIEDAPEVSRLAERYGVRPGSINPNLFQDQEYKFGSICNPDPGIRRRAIDHLVDSANIAKALGSQDLSLWIADGSNYPGAQSIRNRIAWAEEAMQATHAALDGHQRMLIEYKPFEPAFYFTDFADWGMAASLARISGPKAFVLVDTGHHYQSQNIEQIVAWLLHLRLLGGFHFNDRRYADDDLTIGSIDPYQIFRIFHEILNERDNRFAHSVAYMIDQSHNIKPKIEAMVQTVVAAQELFAKALLVDRERLAELQAATDTVAAEECLREAFWSDVRPILEEWRKRHGLPADPLKALRESGYLEKIERERKDRNQSLSVSYA